ncbi:DUF2637 domain-containing protein [Streptomyces sp. BF23-18]|uniref:DUF2637 domain-containing protein n=1 Tax=Streptomyces sp. BF23-18 TaxID=3240282 RepID=UPI0034E49459
MTGLMTLLLNVGHSALSGDGVGVAVHAVAPLLLIVTAEAGLAYRRAIGGALERIERSRAIEKAEREQRQRAERERERAEREHRERSEREHAERLERERAEREASERAAEREHTARLERERFDREAEMRREQREYEERARREEQQRADELKREQQDRMERSRRELLAREQATHPIEQAGDEAPVNTAAAFVNTAVNTTPVPFKKMPEDDARSYIRSFREGQKSVRQLAEDTGWSVGWVAARIHESADEGEPAEAVA